MNTPTEERIRELVDTRKTLKELVDDRFWLVFDTDPSWPKHFICRPDIMRIGFDGDEVEVSCEARGCNRGCCGTDYHTYSFPLSYLWTEREDVLALVQARVDAEKAAQDEKDRIKAEAERSRKEEQDRARLRELAAQYPEEVTP